MGAAGSAHVYSVGSAQKHERETVWVNLPDCLEGSYRPCGPEWTSARAVAGIEFDWHSRRGGVLGFDHAFRVYVHIDEMSRKGVARSVGGTFSN